MFSHRRDASKVALVALVERLQAGGYLLLDTQFVTDHLKRFGALEISRESYQRQLRRALETPATFYCELGGVASPTPWSFSGGSNGSSQSTTERS